MSRILTILLRERRNWLLAGLGATIVLTVFMEGVARLVLGGPMKPAAMICALLGLDQSYLWLGEIAHYATGLIAFPVGFILVTTILDLRPTLSTGALWGVVLWLVAGLVLAPLSGGAIFFGGGRMMLASLVAHLAYGGTLGHLYQRVQKTRL
ncbi:DUF6789 family protein [uncultured Tateyamaria sp.]|uniref:DUF6789 family protein n=1 Tax=uncultured Tateyamaria sp. TaxID=455651 RepID=UPI002626EAA1|nr:DUF6789 family protein [uncultured Tateyamaria sp.]